MKVNEKKVKMGRDFGKKNILLKCKPFWTKEDEKELLELKSKKIDISDTALGRAKSVRHNQLHLAYNYMSENENIFFSLTSKSLNIARG